MTDAKIIGQRLRKLRGTKSMEEVANAVGISLTALSEYEKGLRIPNDSAKLRIADYYGVMVEALFFKKPG